MLSGYEPLSASGVIKMYAGVPQKPNWSQRAAAADLVV